MDSKQIITIIAAAVITACTKSLVEFFTRLATKIIRLLAGMLKRTVIPISERIGRSTGACFSLFMFAHIGMTLYRAVSSVEPLTRREVFGISTLSCLTLYWFVAVIREVGEALRQPPPQ